MVIFIMFIFQVMFGNRNFQGICPDLLPSLGWEPGPADVQYFVQGLRAYRWQSSDTVPSCLAPCPVHWPAQLKVVELMEYTFLFPVRRVTRSVINEVMRREEWENWISWAKPLEWSKLGDPGESGKAVQNLSSAFLTALIFRKELSIFCHQPCFCTLVRVYVKD